jgi:hypothetical protein
MSLSDSPDAGPPGRTPEHPGPLTAPLVPADPAEVASTLAYGLRFDERGRPRRGSVWEMAAVLLAEQLAAQLERANFVVMRKAPRPPHSAG